ncbi:MAG TPA: hypothetical protein VF082_12710 [Jiangellaceae bacterium]
METDPEIEWEYYLADRLGMTVARLREQMSAEEFLRWQVYHGRRAQRMALAQGGE